MAHTLKESLEARVREAERRGLGRRAPVIDRTDMGPMVISGGKMFINYMSNDYIGLSQDMDWRRDVAECFAAWPPSGSASRLAGGFNSITKDAEQACAEYFGYDECLFLPSGYQGNLALVTGLLQPGQTALVDKRIHASTGHALMATRADIRPYAHADMDRLGRRLMKLPEEAGEPCVFTESLFSMDGTVVRPEAFAELKKRRSFFLVADEAHAFGALGEGGRGIFSGERGVADAAIGTLGKALGLFGSFLLLPKGFTPLLEFLSSPIMHSTALPPAHSACMLRLLKRLPELEENRERLRKNAAYLRRRLSELGVPAEGDAHIVSVPVGKEERAAQAAASLFQDGILVLAARFPTVPWGRALLRFGVTSLHTEEMLGETALAVAEALKN